MLWFIVPVLHALGTLAAVHAVFRSRTPEGGIAWAMSLFTFPYLALPLYLIFGRDRFHGYVHALRRSGMHDPHFDIQSMMEKLKEHRYQAEPDEEQAVRAISRLAKIPFSSTCSVELLLDGEATYDALHEAIEQARESILVLFFIVNKDGAGNRLKDHLIAKARAGVRVYFVFDEFGSNKIGGSYLNEMREAGIHAYPFGTARGWRNRFQINFRNHRKIVVIDSRIGFTGGLNIGDECLGKSRHYGAWRDTFVKVQGPAVMALQLAFSEDYHWATGGQLPEVDWTPRSCDSGKLAATYISTGPADVTTTAILFLMECILTARRRIWLASPYFVPDPSIMEALKLASMRGVEVRILIPRARYEPHMRLAALAFLPDLEGTNIKLYEYQGYNHSKVMLVDDWLAWVGSSNLDNRSLRLNFEGNLVVVGPAFAEKIEEMLERDLQNCKPLSLQRLLRSDWLTQLGTKIARLFVPIL